MVGVLALSSAAANHALTEVAVVAPFAVAVPAEVRVTGHARPLGLGHAPAQRVQMLVDGAPAGDTGTRGFSGAFETSVAVVARGVHTVVARHDPGGPLESDSPPATVLGVVTPGSVRDIRVWAGPLASDVTVTWSPPADDGGLVQEYLVRGDRDGRTGIPEVVLPGTTTARTVYGPSSGSYAWVVTARNIAGTSLEALAVATPTPRQAADALAVEPPSLRVCRTAPGHGCTTYPQGTTVAMGAERAWWYLVGGATLSHGGAAVPGALVGGPVDSWISKDCLGACAQIVEDYEWTSWAGVTDDAGRATPTAGGFEIVRPSHCITRTLALAAGYGPLYDDAGASWGVCP